MKGTAIIKGPLLVLLCSVCLNQKSISQKFSNPAKIVWVTNLKGDFSFTKRWSYPEGVYKNEYGQLSCDGLCPTEIENMSDSTGRIYEDSLKAFYQFVDTTHIPHSIECEAWCYEWAGTNFIDVYRSSNDTVFASTWTNVGTHCSLELTIIGDTCIAIIDLKSIAPGGSAKYYCSNGTIAIDQELWKQGILKASFNFDFDHPENPRKPIFWKGKIFSKINAL